jgi:hypothetical protein
VIDNPFLNDPRTNEVAQHLPDAICENCGHEYRHHEDHYGCEVEGPDVYEAGYAPMAAGPCGCTDFVPEPSSSRLQP